jgi:hypothetical protein
MNAMWPPEIVQFLKQHWHSATHRRMMFVGQINTKVAGMFRLTPDETDAPEEARKCAVLWLCGMESGDHAVYAECDKEAMAIYESWRRGLELH